MHLNHCKTIYWKKFFINIKPYEQLKDLKKFSNIYETSKREKSRKPKTISSFAWRKMPKNIFWKISRLLILLDSYFVKDFEEFLCYEKSLYVQNDFSWTHFSSLKKYFPTTSQLYFSSIIIYSSFNPSR